MGRILVVDDEKSIRITLREFLSKAGHDVECTETGEEALDLFRKGEFDVLLTDIIMPRTTGVELLKSVRANMPSTKVIMMTGEPTLDTATESLRAGAFDYLTKPVSKEKVLRIVDNAMHVKKLENSNQEYRENLERLVAKRTEKLKKALEGIVHAMVKAMESRDPYTAGHQKRVADLAEAIAGEMGLSKKRREGLRMAGTIHDLGKISVPTEILVKPGRLGKNEYNIIKDHARAGYEILKDIDFPWPIAQMVYQHHERLDGSGYPMGLSGTEILQESKILAVADVVEAMASHRPYRPALGIEAALDEIDGNSGRIYDEQVVNHCIRLFREKGYMLPT